MDYIKMNSFFAHIKRFFSKSEEKEQNMLSEEVIFNRLIQNEGIKFKPYKCPAGYLTIGVGRNLELNPLSESEKEIIKDVMNGITKDQAFMLLRNDVNAVKQQLDSSLPWWRNLDADRQYVMIDLCFNLGVSKLLGFKNTLKHIAQGNYEQAAENLLKSKYAEQVKGRARRNANCLRSGKYEW